MGERPTALLSCLRIVPLDVPWEKFICVKTRPLRSRWRLHRLQQGVDVVIFPFACGRRTLGRGRRRLRTVRQVSDVAPPVEHQVRPLPPLEGDAGAVREVDNVGVRDCPTVRMLVAMQEGKGRGCCCASPVSEKVQETASRE